MTENNENKLTEDKQNSITLKKDSKGNYNWDIKLYFDNEADQTNTLNRINAIDDSLRRTYSKTE